MGQPRRMRKMPMTMASATDSATVRRNCTAYCERAALSEAIAEATRGWTSAGLVEAMVAAGVPSGPAYRIDEVFADPQVRHLGIAADIDTLPFGPTQLVGQPVALTRTPTRMAAHPPDRGEHTDEILGGLGLSGDEIAGLRQRNII